MVVNNEEKVIRLVGLLNDILKDVYVNLTVERMWFKSSVITIKLSWQNGAHTVYKTFPCDEILRDNGKVLADFIKEETGYDIHGAFKVVDPCKKQNSINKINKEVMENPILLKEKQIKTFSNSCMSAEDEHVNHPEHYTKGGIEVHDFISAWSMDFDTGNVIKYVTRAPYKSNKLEDLKKARWYLNKSIEKAEKEEKHEKHEKHEK